MIKEFSNKNEWAVILGASSGLGLATAIKLARHGMNLCLIYRTRRTELHSVETVYKNLIKENGIQLIHFNLDASKPEKRNFVIENLNKKLRGEGKVKTLIHSIAKGNLKPMQSQDSPDLANDDFHLTIENMALSLFDWTKEIHKNNLFSKDARVLSFTSEGNRKAWPNYAAVSTAKAVLEALTRNIALEFAPYGIRANCIQAGVTDTSSFRLIPGSKELKAHALAKNPYKRLTTPGDVANAVYLLCKDEAAWITGAVIPVNGGEQLQ